MFARCFETPTDIFRITSYNVCYTKLLRSVVDSDNALIMKMQTVHIRTLDDKIETLKGKINQYLLRYATQQSILIGSLLALSLMIALLITVYLSLRAKNKLNRELSLQKKKLVV